MSFGVWNPCPLPMLPLFSMFCVCLIVCGCHSLPFETMDLAHKSQLGKRLRGRSQLKGHECKEHILPHMVFLHVRSNIVGIDIRNTDVIAHGYGL